MGKPQSQLDAQRRVEHWRLHPRGDYFLARGGENVPAPSRCSLALTNRCNLRCEICGSQKMLDATGTKRREMPLALFHSVAETLFPLVALVELNSQGDPLLYSHIEEVFLEIERHHCRYMVQTNGTLFTPRLIDLILRNVGMLSLSLDAVGPKFDEVRRNGSWAQAEPQLEALLRRRDRTRTTVMLYPTVTERTLGEMLAVARWAHDHGVEKVDFHLFDPIDASFERRPTDDAVAAQADRCARELATLGSETELCLVGAVLHAGKPPPPSFASHKQRFFTGVPCNPLPPEAPAADPQYLCAAPNDGVDIGISGEISVCCRAQDQPLGLAVSVEEFARAWLGDNYTRIRRSLERGSRESFCLPNCEGCVRVYAPSELAQRRSVDYLGGGRAAANALRWDEPVLPLFSPRRETAGTHAYSAVLPPGLDPDDYLLWEDDLLLSGPLVLHDDIRRLGGGRHSFYGGRLVFSSSDGSDPIENQRRYELRRRTGPLTVYPVAGFTSDRGLGFVMSLPAGLESERYALCEGARPLGPADAEHDRIRQSGGGAYSIWGRELYFSTSDNSSPFDNGRCYSLRRRDGTE